MESRSPKWASVRSSLGKDGAKGEEEKSIVDAGTRTERREAIPEEQVQRESGAAWNDANTLPAKAR